jgi:TolB-like protein/Tfp pilus assembly protein PilF
MTNLTPVPSPRAYHFESFVLDIGRGVLLVDGEERALRPKSFILLHHFVKNPERLIGRDEIMRAVWPGTFVTEDSITQCIKEIRRALHDEAQILLRTVPRRGYRLATTVSPPETTVALPTAAATPASLHVLLPPPTDRPIVAVTPFENLRGDLEDGYFADGLTNDLAIDLTRFQELHVVSLSPHRLHASDPPTLSPALEESAHYAVSGSVRRTEERIRITVQLKDAQSNLNLWAGRFDRPLDDLFEVQESLSNQIAALVVSHVGREGLRRTLRRSPASLDAYDLYLQGRDLHAKVTEKDTLLARDRFERAISLDPYYAPAHSWLAYMVQRGLTHRWGEPRGRQAALYALKIAQRAVEIEPESGLCLGRLAFILTLNREWDEALEFGRAPIRANPCDSESRFCYGDVLTHAGYPAEAEAELRLALTLNPAHPPTWRASLGRALFVSGRSEEALAELRFCRARMPNHLPCLRTLAAAAATAGHEDEARSAVAGLLSNNPDLTVRDVSETLYFRDPTMMEQFHAGLRMGGLAEA